MEPIVGSGVRSLDERVRSVDGSVVRRMNPSRSRLVETVAPSGLWVPPVYANALGSRLRRAASALDRHITSLGSQKGTLANSRAWAGGLSPYDHLERSTVWIVGF